MQRRRSTHVVQTAPGHALQTEVAHLGIDTHVRNRMILAGLSRLGRVHAYWPLRHCSAVVAARLGAVVQVTCWLGGLGALLRGDGNPHAALAAVNAIALLRDTLVCARPRLGCNKVQIAASKSAASIKASARTGQAVGFRAEQAVVVFDGIDARQMYAAMPARHNFLRQRPASRGPSVSFWARAPAQQQPAHDQNHQHDNQIFHWQVGTAHQPRSINPPIGRVRTA